jgi:hypothetical protein
MQHLNMLATSEGRWVLPGTPEFFAALGDSDPNYDPVAFAVKNLGFVKFEVLDRSTVQIELHPRNVEFPALLAAQQQIFLFYDDNSSIVFNAQRSNQRDNDSVTK